MSYNPFQRSPQSSRSLTRFNSNQTGSTIPKGLPVKITSTGIDLIDVSVESDVDAIAGVLGADALSSAVGSIVTSGTIENIITSFPVGSVVYISKTGTLTNVKPQVGSLGFAEGDFIVKVGMISKNNDDELQKDLIVQLQIIGTL